ncbi:MAG: NAD(P)H-quinone oxidoreductase [Gemmatimonadota bacterium]|jgi:putative PIG3 family NAD(P)H quinone oxidoreductase|nr:NAD(P)H-quinone oxidoreductase [Gemmatimonadota bacterium]
MRAVVIRRPGGPEVLEIGERPVPEPGAGQVRVRVHASALNRADLLQRRGRYPAPPGAPADVPGLEYAGTVEANGPGAGLWAPGNRVMGIVPGGGHAEYLCVYEREAVRIPQKLSWEEAAAVPEAFITAYDALFSHLDLAKGERLLIHAVGSGVGTAATQLARAAGATVIGTSRSPEKLERARELGMSHGVLSTDAEIGPLIREATGGAGVDAVLDLVGGPLLQATLPTLASRGRVAVLGTMGGSKVELDLGMLLQRRLRITGSVMRTRPLEEKVALARTFSQNVLPLFTSRVIRPVIDRVLPFADVVDAHRQMEENRTFGKVVLRW